MTQLPGIIQQRWNAAVENPTIPQWRSLAVWLENFADQCAEHAETRHLVAPLRAKADEAWLNMVKLQPVEVAA